MALIDNIAGFILKRAKIIYKKQLSLNAFHLSIHSENFLNVQYSPGYFLRLFIGRDTEGLSFRDKVRSYSVWNFDRSNECLDLAICTQGTGPGTAWVKKCEVGDEILYDWHSGKFLIDNSAKQYVFIGDLSALGHLYQINRNLSSGKDIHSIIYGKQEDEFFHDIDGSKPFRFYKFYEYPAQDIIDLFSSFKVNHNAMIYVGGDGKICSALNKYLKSELCFSQKQIKVKPFWSPGKKGLE